MTNRTNQDQTEAMIPKRTSPGLIAAIIAGVLVVAMIAIAVVDATTDPRDDGLDNLSTMIGDG